MAAAKMPIPIQAVGNTMFAPRDTQAAPLKKKRKPGKPKVRTGCITCKIRRIKCDEEKPACRRCISTGRTCDGYRPTPPKTSMRRTGMTQPVLINARRAGTTQLLLPRPLITDFAGGQMERHYIHRWLPIAEDVVGIQERGNGLFWGTIIPEYIFTSQSVRHATVALSAAHHNFQLMGHRTDMSSAPSRLEIFIIKNYNEALKMIHKEVENMKAPPPKRFGVIIIACLFFFYTEILLSQWPTAMMHIMNGLKLMTNLPEEINEIYTKPEKWSKGNDDTHTRATYILRLFCRWEVTAGFLASNNRPSTSMSIWKPNQRRSCNVPFRVVGLDHLREVVDVLYQDVCAFLWMCRNNDKEDMPWDYSVFRLQQTLLQQRAHLVGKLLERNRPAFGDLAKVARPEDYLTYQARCLHHRTAAFCLDVVQLPVAPADVSLPWPSPPVSPPQLEPGSDERFEEIIALASLIRETLQRLLVPGAKPWFSMDFGVVSALYLAATNCTEPGMTRRLFAMIRDWPWQENLWDGARLRERLFREEPIETPPKSTETQLVYRPSPGP